MNSRDYLRARRLSGVVLGLIGAAIIMNCGGGGDDANNPPPPPPPPTLLEGVFSDGAAQGVGYTVPDIVQDFTNAEGVFQYVSGEEVEFFLGDADHRLVLGSAVLTAPASGRLTITPRDLLEAQGAESDNVVGNVASLLQTLDADGDHGNGITIDETTRAAIAGAVAGGATPDFTVAGADFAADPAIAAVLAATGRTLVPFARAFANFTTNFAQARSSTIALTSDDSRLVVVNRQKGTVSIITARDEEGVDTDVLDVELPVGREPRFVALQPDDSRAYVTNTADGTVSVIDLAANPPVVLGNPIAVGLEPHGIAVTPNGAYAFIANHTVGAVTILSLSSLEVLGTVATGGNPHAIAITNDGDADDRDERVFVTRIFGEVIDDTRPDGFDDAKQGVVDTFSVGDAVDGTATVTQLVLAPMDSGFTADRRQFCPATRQALQADGSVVFFNSGEDTSGDGAAALANSTYCPDPDSTDASSTGPLGSDSQRVYPNMLNAALVRGPDVYVPNIGAQPEPPLQFRVNIQALVGVLDTVDGAETDRSVSLNAQVKNEIQPADPAASLDRIFMNDVVAIDADRPGAQFLIVSRGGNFVIRAHLDESGRLSIGAPDGVVRLQTGNLPSGVVMSSDGTRAYTNNELSTSVTAIDLENDVVLARDINSSEPPAPGTVDHRRLAGKLAFFTALGIPDVLDTDGDGEFDVALRDIVPLASRGKASDNGWSDCASCHEDGHADNVTWIFETGPRSTIPLEGSFAHLSLDDQRIFNWSPVRGSVTDFNNNARGIQGGRGFASDVNGEDRSALVFNHGPTRGISDALDAMTEWVTTVRAPIMPDLDGDATAASHPGRAVFEANCASCHGGVKWTKSRTAPVYANNPTFAEDPIGPSFFAGVLPLDPNLTVAGPQLKQVANLPGAALLTVLENVGTFDATSPLELRGGGAVAGQLTQGFAPFGSTGFNTPSLLGLAYSGPFLHDGSATTLEAVLTRHTLVTPQGSATIEAALTEQERADLLEFLGSIDNDTATLDSDTDRAL